MFPARPYLSWDQGSHSNHSLRLAASNRPGTAQTDEKKKPSPQRYWAHKPQPAGIWIFLLQHGPQPVGPRHLQKHRQHQHQGYVQLAKRPLATPAAVCWENVNIVLQYPTARSANEVSLLHRSNIYSEVFDFSKQARTLAWIPQSPHIQSGKV